jgi:hypothetical protein
MGGVNFQYLVKPGITPTTSFSSTMKNLGGALAGTNFYACFSKGNGSAGVNIDAQINSGASGIVFGSGSGVNDNPTRVAFFPQAVDNNAMRAGCQTRGQFAQWTLVSRAAGIDCECPLICFGDPSGNDGGYILTVQSESTNVSLQQGWELRLLMSFVQIVSLRFPVMWCAWK